MSKFAGAGGLGCDSVGQVGRRKRQENTTNGWRDKSGSLRFRKPLLSHGFSRAGRSGRVPRLILSPTISTVFPALSTGSLAIGQLRGQP